MRKPVLEALAEGVIGGLNHESGAGSAVSSRLHIGADQLAIDAYLGAWLRIDHLGGISCSNCAALTPRSFGGGYCYRCFTTLARCDLCVVSPDRCHYAKGTCREPQWGESYCMRPHVVYLANSGGAKVGITHPDNLPGRWLDQGASAAAVIIEAPTRHAAGCAEKVIARHLRESTDWRALVSSPPAVIDLVGLWREIRMQTAAALRDLDFGLTLIDDPMVREFTHARAAYAPAVQLKFDEGEGVAGQLIGAIGSYLMFDRGVFNVRAHGSYHVRLSRIGPLPAHPVNDQMELF